jgi:hypothetical protein
MRPARYGRPARAADAHIPEVFLVLISSQYRRSMATDQRDTTIEHNDLPVSRSFIT